MYDYHRYTDLGFIIVVGGGSDDKTFTSKR